MIKKRSISPGSQLESQIILLFFIVLFILPVLFTRVDGQISWKYVFKIWQDQVLLIPLFAINHWILVPSLVLKRRYALYVLSILSLIALFTVAYYYYDQVLFARPMNPTQPDNKRPTPIPPYAHLLMYSLLIAGVDTGLLALRRLHQNEKRQEELEKKNAKMQLDILRQQVSPHFLMNTLNNIYGLMDIDVPRAREAVIKLSRLMRFMLYENSSGKVRISKEFEFIGSYIDLMHLRYNEGVSIQLHLPENYPDLEIPPLLFISYIENAFKHGVSYQAPSRIDIGFEVDGNRLRFVCNNTLHKEPSGGVNHGGVGLKNSENRLKLLFGNAFQLQIKETGKLFSVLLLIPVS